MKVMAQTKEFRTHTQRHRTAILGTLSSSYTANRLNKLYFDGLPAINWSNETVTYKTSRAILL